MADEKFQAPVVLLFGFGYGSVEGLKTDLGLKNRYVEKIAGGPITFLRMVPDYPWWVDPSCAESMHELLFNVFDKKRTPAWIENWIQSVRFEEHVRKDIELSLTNGFAGGFNERVREAVKIVVLHHSLRPDQSDYVRRVFDGLFPCADFYMYQTEGMLDPLWVDVPLIPLVQLPPRREQWDGIEGDRKAAGS